MRERQLRFAEHALGRPYHAALVTQSPSSGPSELHGHADYFEFMAVLSGRGLHVLPGRAQRLHPGDVALARPHDRHALQGLAPQGMRFVNIAFPAAAWRGFANLARTPDGARDGDPPVWRLRGAAARRCREVFDTALHRFHSGPTMVDLIRFWTDLLETVERSAAGRGEQPATPIPEWLRAARALMHEEAHLRGGVAAMSRLAAVSPAHLSRSMRAHYRTTPTRFVNELRLERAVQLLGTTEETVTRIAHRCGFASQSYFTRCFTASYGTPPQRFRTLHWQAFVPS